HDHGRRRRVPDRRVVPRVWRAAGVRLGRPGRGALAPAAERGRPWLTLRSYSESWASGTRSGGDGRAGLGTCTTNPETVSTTSRSNTSIAWFSIDGIGSGQRHCALPSESSPALSAVLSQWGHRMADRAPTITELIARVGRDPEAVRSVRALASLHDGPFYDWRS